MLKLSVSLGIGLGGLIMLLSGVVIGPYIVAKLRGHPRTRSP